MSEFNLSEKIFKNHINYRDNEWGSKVDILETSDVKEFIYEIEFSSLIDLKNDMLSIRYSDFKKLAGDKLIEEIERGNKE